MTKSAINNFKSKVKENRRKNIQLTQTIQKLYKDYISINLYYIIGKRAKIMKRKLAKLQLEEESI